MIRLFTSPTFNSLDDLLIEQIEDLYDAEHRLIQALPKMADAAHSPQLQSAFREHLRETEGHARILEQVFRDLNKEPERETCEAMKGLIQEGEEMVSAEGDPAVKDAALIAAAQRVEHYEISGYGTARTFAERLGLSEVARQLEQILEQEKSADKKLTEIAEENINLVAAEHSR
jgi:ferritin-like metal-binding protein YciE